MRNPSASVLSAHIALLLATGAAAAACPPAFIGAHDGTYYTDTAGSGACAIEWAAGEHIAAMNAVQWDGSAHCGECLMVTGPLGSTLVKVVDLCPECISGDLDLSLAAFSAIANPIDGRVSIIWQRVECPVVGNFNFRFEGSNPFYLKLQALNHRQGVQAMSVFHNGNYQTMARSSDNHFEYLPGAEMMPPLSIRLTSTTGQMLDQSISSITNNTILPGTAQFSTCVDGVFADGFE